MPTCRASNRIPYYETFFLSQSQEKQEKAIRHRETARPFNAAVPHAGQRFPPPLAPFHIIRSDYTTFSRQGKRKKALCGAFFDMPASLDLRIQKGFLSKLVDVLENFL